MMTSGLDPRPPCTLLRLSTRPSTEKLGAARRSAGRSGDDEGVTHPQVRPDPAFGLLELFDDALPHVYGYLLARCGDTGLAEDLTAESFPAALHAVRKPGVPDPSIPWLIEGCPAQACRPLAAGRAGAARVAPAGRRAGARR